MLLALPRQKAKAFTLLELVLASAILVAASLGVLMYQYYTIKHSKIAGAEMIAVRSALLILEDWKSSGGAEDYDPVSLNLGWTRSGQDYDLTIDQLPIRMSLASVVVDKDTDAAVVLKQLDVQVKWRKDYTDGDLDSDNHDFTLTTYVRADQASG